MGNLQNALTTEAVTRAYEDGLPAKHEVVVGLEVFGDVKREMSNVKRETRSCGRQAAPPTKAEKSVWFKEINPRGKAKVWNVYDQKDALVGQVRYFKERNRYVFEPEGWQVFDSDMMEEISLVMRDGKLCSINNDQLTMNNKKR